jgi:hypothetical protein
MRVDTYATITADLLSQRRASVIASRQQAGEGQGERGRPAVREACATIRATGQSKEGEDKEQYRVESPLCMYLGSVC